MFLEALVLASVLAVSPDSGRIRQNVGWTAGGFLGSYFPINVVVWEDEDGGTFKKRQVGSLAFGARIGRFVSQKFSIETSFGFAPAFAAVTNRSFDFEGDRKVIDKSSHFLWANTRLGFRLKPQTKSFSFWAALGAGVLARTGAINRKEFTVPVAVGVQTPYEPMSFRIDIEDNILHLSRHDFVVALSVMFPL